MLKVNTTLVDIKYAAACPFPHRQGPITPPDGTAAACVCSLPHSLFDNGVGSEGAKSLGKALETNSTLRVLEYAAANPYPLSAPADASI